MRGYYGDRNWTDDQVETLAALLSRGRSDASIARSVGRSAVAIELKRKRLGLLSRKRLLLSSREVARRLGVGCSKSVTKWIQRGYLDGRRGLKWGPNRRWYVTEEALYDFVGDARYRHLWSESAIADAGLRAFAREAHKPARFLTVGQVAQRYVVAPGTVSQWIRKGWLKAVRNGNWMVPEGALVGFAPKPMGGKRSGVRNGG